MSDHAQNLPAVVPTPLIFTFTNGKPHAVRVHTDDQGEPLFHVGDLCGLLEHVNTRQALRTHVESDDVQKLDVIDRMGRKQSANFVTEPGMWSLVLGSHAPNAKKVKRWVVTEVLPAIRKTGRYQAHQAQPEPAPAPDYLTNAERETVAHLVAQICRDKFYQKAWTFATWAGIRRVSGTKGARPLEVAHIPAVAAELERVYTAVSTWEDAVRQGEKEFLRRVFRNGEDAAVVVAQIEARILKPALAAATDFSLTLAAWQRRDIIALRSRQARTFPIAASPEGQEPEEVAA